MDLAYAVHGDDWPKHASWRGRWYARPQDELERMFLEEQIKNTEQLRHFVADSKD